jgi:hypothetical protein
MPFRNASSRGAPPLSGVGDTDSRAGAGWAPYPLPMTHQSSSSRRWRCGAVEEATWSPPSCWLLPAIHNFRRNASPLARSLASIPKTKICSDPLFISFRPAASVRFIHPSSEVPVSSPVHCEVGIVLALLGETNGAGGGYGREEGGASAAAASGGGGGEQGEEEARPGGAAADRGPDQPAGALLEAPDRAVQEGLRALRALRRPGRAHRLLPRRPPLRVRLLHLQVTMICFRPLTRNQPWCWCG